MTREHHTLQIISSITVLLLC